MNRGGRDRVGGSFRYHRSGTGVRDGAGVGSCNYTLSVQKKTSCYVIIRKILLIKFPQLIFVGNCILTGAFPLPRPPGKLNYQTFHRILREIPCVCLDRCCVVNLFTFTPVR